MIESNQLINSLYMLAFLESLLFYWPSLENLRFFSPFWRILESIELFYRNELTQSPMNSLGKGTESIQLILKKNDSIWINNIKQVDWYTCLCMNGKGEETLNMKRSGRKRCWIRAVLGPEQSVDKSSSCWAVFCTNQSWIMSPFGRTFFAWILS